jgi:hypothetical protein
LVDVPVKYWDMQAAMNTHLSQPTGDGDGAFDGQQGMSLAISSVVADADISSAIPCIDPPEDVFAMRGRETGASAKPAITRIASSRRMVKVRFTELNSHRLAAMESPPLLHTIGSIWPALINIKAANEGLGAVYLLDRPITAISSDIFSR